MKAMRVPGLLLLILLVLAGCSKPVELGGVYIVDEYGGDSEAIKAFVGSFGYELEATSDGYAFYPFVVLEGESYYLSEKPWQLLKSQKNRYRIFLYFGDLYGLYAGQEAMAAELDKDAYIFNYTLDVKAREGALKGKIIGAGAKDPIQLSLQTEGSS